MDLVEIVPLVVGHFLAKARLRGVLPDVGDAMFRAALDGEDVSDPRGVCILVRKEPVGFCVVLDEDQEFMAGIHKDFQGLGLVKAAAQKLLADVFSSTPDASITAKIDPANPSLPAARGLAIDVGFTDLGLIDGMWRFRLTRTSWRQPTRWSRIVDALGWRRLVRKGGRLVRGLISKRVR